ncbi:hypothetical protein [Deinococcus hopiensis]|uniref:hypothetical protein n=1 Tax=Deinococcus hopiensis TaxID=309885 RepID=UPI001BB06F58|nr:hypothetical protein [Deinococcus hopiensis]
MLSFSEAIREELRGTGVTVTALCPGPIQTGFQNRAQMNDSRLVKGRAILDDATVARQGVSAMLRGQNVINGKVNQLLALTPRFLPRRLIPGGVKRAQARSHQGGGLKNGAFSWAPSRPRSLTRPTGEGQASVTFVPSFRVGEGRAKPGVTGPLRHTPLRHIRERSAEGKPSRGGGGLPGFRQI